MFLTRYTITIKPDHFFYALEETVVSPIEAQRKEMLMFRGLDVWKTPFDTLESLSMGDASEKEAFLTGSP